jgi:uncharacterized damage-inducible protein DinB
MTQITTGRKPEAERLTAEVASSVGLAMRRSYAAMAEVDWSWTAFNQRRFAVILWRPHPKSGTMGWLASHLATLPTLAVRTIEKESLEIAPGGQPPSGPPKLKTRQEVLETFDRNRNAARAAIAGAWDEHLINTWTLLFNGKTVFSLPRAAVLRGAFMNHTIHHRAQLGVYLRLNEVPVPALYGPSADEQFSAS